jgi:hypothetical protein
MCQWIQLTTLRFSITFFMAGQNLIGGIEVLGPASKNPLGFEDFFL